MEGQPEEALVTLQHAASIQRRLGDRSREALALDGTGEAYRDLGRLDDADRFHRTAAIIHREVDDEWHRAIALAHLAEVLAATGNQQEEKWRQAMTALDTFTDPRAAALKGAISAAIDRLRLA